MMIARLVFPLLFALSSALPASALEIYRNSVRYDIIARLPGGADYIVDGVDRKFSLPGVSGNLRLIQDEYSSCESLVDERRQNWIKYGFTLSYGRHVSRSECSITIESAAESKAISSYYVRVDRCGCYAALHLSYSTEDRSPFMAAAPEIVGSLRSNNSGRAGPDYPDMAGLPVAAIEPAPRLKIIAGPPEATVVEPATPALATRELAPGEGLERLSKALASFSCLSRESRLRPRETAIIALSAWSGQSIRTLGRQSGRPDFADLLLETFDFKELSERAAAAADAVILAQSGMIDTIERDADTYGDRLCPILNTGLPQYLSYLVQQQSEFQSVFHASLAAAQRLMALHECSDAEIDGAFGPASRANWNKMLAALGLPTRDDTYTPGVSDIAQVASIKVTAAACDPSPDPGGLAVSPLDFLGEAGGGASWLEIINDDVSATMDEIARAGEWTPWQTRLALRLFSTGHDENSDTRERLLVALYENGVGVAVNRQAARHWRSKTKGSQSPYSLYLAALADPSRIKEAVGALSASGYPEYESQSRVPSGPLQIPGAAEISIAEYADLAHLATLVMRYPQALDEVISTAKAPYLFKLAERLLEGASIDGKGAEQAAILLEAAADQGADYAASRLAFMLQYGLGAPADRQKARQFAEMAARAKDPFALYQLARLDEQDQPGNPKPALAAYERLFKAIDTQDNYFMPGLVTNRIMNGSVALTSIDGEKLVGKYGLTDGTIYMCTDCGGVVDLPQAARLLRQTHPDRVDFYRKDKIFQLFQLITEHPELAKSKDEAQQLLTGGITPPEDGSSLPFGSQSDIRSILGAAIMTAGGMMDKAQVPSAIADLLDRICSDETIRNYFCETAANSLASGRFGGPLVAPGIARLKQEDSIYLIDVLAAFGDFKGALDQALRLEQKSRSSFPFGVLEAGAAPVFRRLLTHRSLADMDGLPEGLEDLLRFHARHDDTTARQYLELIAAPRAAVADALSTAACLMPDAAHLARLVAQFPNARVVHVGPRA